MGKQKNYLLLVLKGCAMGAADVVPGVSGGTIAFITGIYEELIDSIKSIDLQALKLLLSLKFADFWKKINGSFLLGVAGGIAISIFSLAKLMTWLLEHDLPAHEPSDRHLVVFLRFDRRFVGTGSQRNQTLAYRYGDLTDCRRLYRLCHYRDVAGRDSQYVVVYHLIRRHSYLCHDFTGHIRGIHFTTDGEILLYPRSCQQPEHRGDVVIHRRSGCRYHQFFPSVILAFKKISYSDSRYPNGIHGRVSE